MGRRDRRRLAGGFALQSVAVALWWVGLAAWPGFIDLFIGPSLPKGALWVFLPADAAVYGGLGLLAARRVAADHPQAAATARALLGGVLYAALATLGLAWVSGGGWVGVLGMGASLAFTSELARRVRT